MFYEEALRFLFGLYGVVAVEGFSLSNFSCKENKKN